jgi:hypothetical protein
MENQLGAVTETQILKGYGCIKDVQVPGQLGSGWRKILDELLILH